MQALLPLACASQPCSCASAPAMQSSVNGYGFSSGPTSAGEARVRRPQFCMDDAESTPAWRKAAPLSNR
jgi:hypothetical protein